MYRVKTSLGAVTLLSGAAGFGLLLNKWGQFGPWQISNLTFDQAIQPFIGGGAAFGALFLAGHLALRWANLFDSVVYGVLGALTGMMAFMLWGGAETLKTAGEQGAISLAIGMPLLVGMVLGLAYSGMAGKEVDNEDAAYASLMRQAVTKDGTVVHGVMQAEGVQFYSGPVQVRTSIPLLFASGAAVGGILAAFTILCGLLLNSMNRHFVGSMLVPFGMHYGLSMATITMVSFCLGLFFPILISHKVAQHFKITSSGGYAMTGIAVNIALCVIFLPSLFAILPCALALPLYRRWAGLEPVGLPEDVHTNNPQLLVGEDHPLRQYHKVVG